MLRWRETKVVFKSFPKTTVKQYFTVEEKQKLYLNEGVGNYWPCTGFVEEKQKLYLNEKFSDAKFDENSVEEKQKLYLNCLLY